VWPAAASGPCLAVYFRSVAFTSIRAIRALSSYVVPDALHCSVLSLWSWRGHAALSVLTILIWRLYTPKTGFANCLPGSLNRRDAEAQRIFMFFSAPLRFKTNP